MRASIKCTTKDLYIEIKSTSWQVTQMMAWSRGLWRTSTMPCRREARAASLGAYVHIQRCMH